MKSSSAHSWLMLLKVRLCKSLFSHCLLHACRFLFWLVCNIRRDVRTFTFDCFSVFTHVTHCSIKTLNICLSRSQRERYARHWNLDQSDHCVTKSQANEIVHYYSTPVKCVHVEGAGLMVQTTVWRMFWVLRFVFTGRKKRDQIVVWDVVFLLFVLHLRRRFTFVFFVIEVVFGS